MKKSILCLSIATISYLGFAPLSSAAPDAYRLSDDDVLSISQRVRPDYAPDGKRVGGFLLNSSTGLNVTSSSNIFATDSGDESDIINSVTPAASLSSNWNNHFIAADISANLRRYSENDSESYNNFQASSYGRFDILRSTFVDGTVAFNRYHEDRGSADDVNGVEPTEIDETKTQIGFSRKLRKISLELASEAKYLNYKNVSTTTGFVDNTGRDRTEYQWQAKVGYEIIPNYDAFLSGTYNIREYDNIAAFDRDSEGFDISAGTDINLTGKVKASLGVGYMQQRYNDDAALGNIDGVKFSGDVIWNVTGLTSILAGVARSIEETTIGNSSGYKSTLVTVGAEHELLRNLILSSGVSFTNNDYAGGTGLQREDDIFGFSFNTQYMLSRGVAVNFGYDLVNRDSNIVNSDYHDNRINTGITFSL